MDHVKQSADHYQEARKKVTQDGLLIPGLASLEEVNRRLLMNERKLTSGEGLPGRPWFQHMIYAPGFYTGYAVKTLPGAREAIEQKKWKEADEQIARVARTLEDEAAWIDGIAAELEKAKIARPISGN